MNTLKLLVTVSLGMFLVACGGGGSSSGIKVPDAPTGVSVAAGATAGTTASVVSLHPFLTEAVRLLDIQ